MSIRPDPEWATKVRQGLSFLFDEYGASLVDSAYRSKSFGLETAVVAVGNLILTVSRNEKLPPSYIEARIAPAHAPNDLKPPLIAWMALVLMQGGKVLQVPAYKEFGTFDGLSKLLQESLLPLNEAFSVDNYPRIREKMVEVELRHWKEWKQEHSQESR